MKVIVFSANSGDFKQIAYSISCILNFFGHIQTLRRAIIHYDRERFTHCKTCVPSEGSHGHQLRIYGNQSLLL